MNRILGNVTLFAIAITLPAAAAAQAAAAPAMVTLMAGAAMPLGDLDDAVKAGFTLGGGVEFGSSTLPFGVRAEVGYTSFGEKNASGDLLGSPFSARSKASNLSVTLNALFAPSVPAAQIRPYALGGVGFYNSTVDAGYQFGADAAQVNDSKGSVGFNGGAGVRFQFVGFSSFVEVRYHHVTKARVEQNETTGDFDWKSAAYVPITFGISLGGR